LNSSQETLRGLATEVLSQASPTKKITKSFEVANKWLMDNIPIGDSSPPREPGRPDLPILCSPRAMPKRSTGTKGRIALIHAITHIEFNAINLAWDIIARFSHASLNRAYYDDWVKVAIDETNHFQLLSNRLLQLNSSYGELPAHNGLWEAAKDTSNDLLARLAVVPMTLEARALDTAVGTANRLQSAGDHETARILDIVYRDEIKHVAVGCKWFKLICKTIYKNPVSEYKRLVRTNYRGALRGPFNYTARNLAGFTADFFDWKE